MKKPMVHEKGDCRITKMRLIREVNNSMCHNFYYEAKWRIYVDATHFYRGNFVVWFDTYDLAERYPQKESFCKKDILDYAKELAYCFLDTAPSDNLSADKMREFYGECRETIDRYNGNGRLAS